MTVYPPVVLLSYFCSKAVQVFLPGCRVSAVRMLLLGFDNSYIRKIAVLLGIVEPVSNDEFVRDLEAAVIDRNIAYTSVRLVKEGAKAHALRLSVLDKFKQAAECPAGIDDILDHQDVLALQRLIKVFDYLDRSA